MNHFGTSLFCLLTIFAGTSTLESAVPTPAPAPGVQFTLPLTDSTNGTAVLLPTHDGEAWLVYATSSGKLGTYYLIPQNHPIPPTPDPPIPPIPPTPDPPIPPPLEKLHIAIVEDPARTTLQQRDVLSDPKWRAAASSQHWFEGIIPNDVKEIKTGLPPANLLPFLERAKLHNLPWVIMCNEAGVIRWEGPLPATAEELFKLIPDMKEKKRESKNNNDKRLEKIERRSSTTSRHKRPGGI